MQHSRLFMVMALAVGFILLSCSKQQGEFTSSDRTRKMRLSCVALDGDVAGVARFNKEQFDKRRINAMRAQTADSRTQTFELNGFAWYPLAPIYPRSTTDAGRLEIDTKWREDVAKKPWGVRGRWFYSDPTLKKNIGRGFFDQRDFRLAEKSIDSRGGKALTLYLAKNRQEEMKSFSTRMRGRELAVILNNRIEVVATIAGQLSDEIQLARGNGGFSEREQAEILLYFRH